MVYTRKTVDFDKLMIGCLTADASLAGLRITRALDVQSITQVPLLLESGFNGHAVQNGAWYLGWTWTLGLSLMVDARADDGEWADRVHVAVHGMDERQAAIAGVGHVNSVEDDTMFAASPSVLVDDKLVRQYDGTWTVIVRPVFT